MSFNEKNDLDLTRKETLSDVFNQLSTDCAERAMTLGELIDRLSSKGHMFICLVFASPFLLPIPLPGLSTIFGAVIFIAAAQLIFGQKLWVPRSWLSRKLPESHTSNIFKKFSVVLKRTEHLIKPRFESMIAMPWTNRMNGVALLILSLLLSLPMPPGFNAPPAFSICLICLGSLEEDGKCIALGWILTLFNMALFTMFFYLGWEGVKALMSFAA